MRVILPASLLSANNLCKEFGPRCVSPKCWAILGPNCLTLFIFLKLFFENVNNLCKEFGPRCDSTTCWAVLGPNCLTLIIFLKCLW